MYQSLYCKSEWLENLMPIKNHLPWRVPSTISSQALRKRRRRTTTTTLWRKSEWFPQVQILYTTSREEEKKLECNPRLAVFIFVGGV
ncbi:hypothetical protein AB3S75_018237 [Citrus x aurantiifolia]